MSFSTHFYNLPKTEKNPPKASAASSIPVAPGNVGSHISNLFGKFIYSEHVAVRLLVELKEQAKANNTSSLRKTG